MAKKYEKAIVCADGYQLTTTVYEPEAGIKAAVMIAPATGIKQGFYNSFATHLAENGYGVICFDNRGIGKSIDPNAKDQELSLITWGRQDMTAILEALKQIFPNTNYHLVGHSAGGQLIGLMDNYADIRVNGAMAAAISRPISARRSRRKRIILMKSLFLPNGYMRLMTESPTWPM